MTSAFRLAATAAAALLVSHAQAATTVHTDQASFMAAIAAGAYTETFDGLDSNIEPSMFSGNGFSYTMSAPGGLYASGTDVGTNLPEKILTISFTGGPVSAVGGNFYSTDINPSFLFETITVTLSDGTTQTYEPASTATFLGFTSTAGISSLTVEFASFWIGRYATVDNLTVGASLVPEPGQWALMGLGLAALGLVKRRRAA